MPGRNEPCPCGSAVKYKRCCLPRVDAIARELRDRDALLADMIDWLKDEHDPTLDDASHETTLIRTLRGTAGRNMSLVWAINDVTPCDGGPPLTARFAARAGLDPARRQIALGLADARLEVFRVAATISDQWMALEPLRGGRRIDVMTDGGFAGLQVDQILVARVVHGTSMPTVWGLVMMFPPTSRRRWLARLEQLPADRAQAALAVLAFHPDDAVEPLPDDVEVIDTSWLIADDDAVLDALEGDPLFECGGEAVPDGWAFSWLGDAEYGCVDLGGWREDDDKIEIARLVVRENAMTLFSGDRETLGVVASHVEQELAEVITRPRLAHAA